MSRSIFQGQAQRYLSGPSQGHTDGLSETWHTITCVLFDTSVGFVYASLFAITD